MGALAALSVMVDGTKTLLSAAEERFVIFEYSHSSAVVLFLGILTANNMNTDQTAHKEQSDQGS